MTARLGSMTCCDFCPRAHTRECLTRHSTEARESARSMSQRTEPDGQVLAEESSVTVR